MKKSDLKYGNVIETRNGDRYLYTMDTPDHKNFLQLNLVSTDWVAFMNYDTIGEDLKGVVKVYEDYTCGKVLWERPKLPRLCEAERAILSNIDEQYKYIARDKSGNLFIYVRLPLKFAEDWKGGNFHRLTMFNHLFQFIKWEDNEAYLIEDLLKG